MKPVRVPDLRLMKQHHERITVLTAYDATMARILDRAGIDIILVGDSLGMVVLGYPTTLPVTLDMMIHHTAAVARGTERALVVADMPFLTYQLSTEEAMRNAGRLIKEGNAAAVKIEGGEPMVETARRLADVGVPVMGHLGLTPQSVHKFGGFRPQARDPQSASQLLLDAAALEKAGVFAIVLESIPDDVAKQVTSSIGIPTIGIGAGPHCDGQVLVSYDALGLYDGPMPPFVKQFARAADELMKGAKSYIEDVRAGRFPPAREDGR